MGLPSALRFMVMAFASKRDLQEDRRLVQTSVTQSYVPRCASVLAPPLHWVSVAFESCWSSVSLVVAFAGVFTEARR